MTDSRKVDRLLAEAMRLAVDYRAAMKASGKLVAVAHDAGVRPPTLEDLIVTNTLGGRLFFPRTPVGFIVVPGTVEYIASGIQLKPLLMSTYSDGGMRGLRSGSRSGLLTLD